MSNEASKINVVSIQEHLPGKLKDKTVKDWYGFFKERNQQVVQEYTAGIDPEDDATRTKLVSGIVEAMKYLASEAPFIAELAPKYPASWSLDLVWTACLMEICNEKLIAAIGGNEGEKLPLVASELLLPLVAAVENLCDLPTVPSMPIDRERKLLNAQPTLSFDKAGNSVDAEGAENYIAYLNNILCDIHVSAKVEFIFRTKEQAEEHLSRTYSSEGRQRMEQTNGNLITSLPVDVYAYMNEVLAVVLEQLPKTSTATVQMVGILFKALYDAQRANKDKFLTDFEGCCAASNDFLQIKANCAEIISKVKTECILSEEANTSADNVLGAVSRLYQGDATYAAQKISIFIFKDFESLELFTTKWPKGTAEEDLAGTIVSTMENYMPGIQKKLNQAMIPKVIEALAIRFATYIVELLLHQASATKKSKESFFSDKTRGVEAIKKDIDQVHKYFSELAGEESKPLKDAIEINFAALNGIHKVMSWAAGLPEDDGIRDSIRSLQMNIKSYDLTYSFLGDLCGLVKPDSQERVYEEMAKMEEDLRALEEDNADSAPDTTKEGPLVPELCLYALLKKHVADTPRVS